ncbi:MAG: hypothetical protein V4638_12555 [Bacteroidota bacterium]
MRILTLIFLLLLVTSCGVNHNAIRFVKNEAIVEHTTRSEKKNVDTSAIRQAHCIASSATSASAIRQFDNSTSSLRRKLIASQAHCIASSAIQFDIESGYIYQRPSKKIYEKTNQNIEGEPEAEILAAAKRNERKANTTLGLSISSLVLNIIFPYAGIILTIIAWICYLVTNRNRYFTLKGDRVMRKSFVLLLIASAILLLLITAVTLLILFW